MSMPAITPAAAGGGHQPAEEGESGKMKKLDYGFLAPARNMPPLYHTLPDGQFDIMKSEVVNYLVRIPEIRQKIFDMAMNHGVIQYDPYTRIWKGVNWDK